MIVFVDDSWIDDIAFDEEQDSDHKSHFHYTHVTEASERHSINDRPNKIALNPAVSDIEIKPASHDAKVNDLEQGVGFLAAVEHKLIALVTAPHALSSQVLLAVVNSFRSLLAQHLF